MNIEKKIQGLEIYSKEKRHEFIKSENEYI